MGQRIVVQFARKLKRGQRATSEFQMTGEQRRLDEEDEAYARSQNGRMTGDARNRFLSREGPALGNSLTVADDFTGLDSPLAQAAPPSPPYVYPGMVFDPREAPPGMPPDFYQQMPFFRSQNGRMTEDAQNRGLNRGSPAPGMGYDPNLAPPGMLPQFYQQVPRSPMMQPPKSSFMSPVLPGSSEGEPHFISDHEASRVFEFDTSPVVHIPRRAPKRPLSPEKPPGIQKAQPRAKKLQYTISEDCSNDDTSRQRARFIALRGHFSSARKPSKRGFIP